MVVKEVDPPKAAPKIVAEQPKKVTKKDIVHSTGTGKNDLPFEEMKGRVQGEGKKVRQRVDSLDEHSDGSDSEDDYFPQPKKGDAAKKKVEEKKKEIAAAEEKKMREQQKEKELNAAKTAKAEKLAKAKESAMADRKKIEEYEASMKAKATKKE
jgi:hypothetical protein